MSGTAQFRRLLRSAKYAFGRDRKALQLAALQLRSEFLKHKHVVDPKVLTTLYKDVDDVDEMLRYHIVQGVRTDEGSYGRSSWNLVRAHFSFLPYFRRRSSFLISSPESCVHAPANFPLRASPAAVTLKPEHHATIGAEQDRQFGPELAPIDPSFLGSSVGVTKVKPCSSQRVAPKDLGDVTKN